MEPTPDIEQLVADAAERIMEAYDAIDAASKQAPSRRFSLVKTKLEEAGLWLLEGSPYDTEV